MKFKIIKFVAVGLLLIASAGNSSAQKSIADHETEIRQVAENFRTALIKKDRSLLLGLFSEGKIGWQSVTADTNLARIRLKNPKAVKVETKETHLSFIDFIVGDAKRTEETFADIKISTDGEVAAVGFDYVFLYDNRENNRGKEYWLLVRTENGWKITSVVWSEIMPPSEGK